MSNILFVTSSLFGDNSKSREVGLDIVARLRDADPGASVTMRDTNSIPHYSGELLSALMTPEEQRNPHQAKTAAFADELVAEIEAAETIVIAAPMYNFTISSPLKAWLDHVARAGRTFRYSAAGPEGLLKDRKVFVVASRGGFYGDGPGKAMDFQEPYLRAMLGFLGLTDITFIPVEGLSVSPGGRHTRHEQRPHGGRRAHPGRARRLGVPRLKRHGNQGRAAEHEVQTDDDAQHPKSGEGQQPDDQAGE
jgi:FMN-dependent NADH-azoreductase